MKITVLCGEDTKKSDERYLKIVTALKKRGWEIVDLKDQSLSALESMTSSSLFSSEILFVLSNPAFLKEKDYKYLLSKKDALSVNLLIYYNHDLPQALKKQLQGVANIEKFDLPEYIWAFLDSIKEKNAENSLKLFRKSIATHPPELILALLSGRLREIYLSIKEPTSLKLPIWRVSKLKSQAKGFDLIKIKTMIENLARIDLSVKTSLSDLTSELDLFIIKELQ